MSKTVLVFIAALIAGYALARFFPQIGNKVGLPNVAAG
jgi:hypothetical protein